MPVVRIGDISSLGLITGFTGSITKIVINSTQVYTGSQAIELEAGKTFVIKTSWKVTPSGDIASTDRWNVGVTAKMGTQSGGNTTWAYGSGEKTGTSEIGDLEGPTSDSTLNIKLYAIDKPTAPSLP